MATSDDFLNHNINRLMQDKSEWIMDRVATRGQGQPDRRMTETEGKIMGTLRGRELTVSEIARLRGVSRQAIHRTVTGLVEKGYVRLDPAPGSERDKIVVITAEGQKLRRQVGQRLKKVEDKIAKAIGKDRLEALRSVLMEDWD